MSGRLGLGQQYPRPVRDALAVLWGKSDAGGVPNLLLQHLLDTAAVGELLWDDFLAPTICARLDRITDRSGRRFLSWLCAAHDLGKATPAFQQQVPALAERVRGAGLTLGCLGIHPNRSWRHELASARIIVDAATSASWSEEARGWVWPLLAGHHGSFPDRGSIRLRRRALHAPTHEWQVVQEALVGLVTTACGYDDLAAVEPVVRPPRALQLALSGFVIMADWIASDERHFPGVDQLESVTPELARERARRAWEELGLRRGWGQLPEAPADPIRERFGVTSRPGQQCVVEAAAAVPAPGLIVVEAPTGEGKTEAALAAAEILSARFGADGVFVGMPTQATCDPMLHRLGDWAGRVHPGVQVALLHGKRQFNQEWRRLLSKRDAARIGGNGADAAHDQHGLPLEYGEQAVVPSGIDEGGAAADEAVAAVEEWLLGRKRGLLSPNAVGTIDQLLFAATRTKHVSLRFAGLAGKVVILDEVHAADVYMEQFLCEALWWLGECGVTVILLSATLAPRQRAELFQEYLRGALSDPHLDLADDPQPEGYPCTTAAWVQGAAPSFRVNAATSWRPTRPVGVEVLDDAGDDPSPGIVAHVQAAVADGGCVLVVLNTVRRAQATHRALRDTLDCDVMLLHGRLTASDRAERTQMLLERLGPGGRTGRPKRLVVVATQVAEQSFDVDVDLLITDLAPVDLLLQRAGRLHRHALPVDARPPALAEPRLVVTGMQRNEHGPPAINRSTLMVYGEAGRAASRPASQEQATPYRAALPLLRSAAFVQAAAGGAGWRLPDDVPVLVAKAYGVELVTPKGWHAAERQELEAFEALQHRRAKRANPFRLAKAGERSAPTLAGIHGRDTGPHADEEELRAVVRDGPQGAEVLLVERTGERYRSLDGYDFGTNGEGIHTQDGPDAAIGGTVRLPATWPELTETAERLGPCLPEWMDHPWLKHAHVLVLEHGEADVAGYRIRYDRDLGLSVEPPDRATPARAGTT